MKVSRATRKWGAGEAAVVVVEPEAEDVEVAMSEVEAAEGAKGPVRAVEEVKGEAAKLIERVAFPMISPG